MAGRFKIARFDVYLVALDPTIGTEIRKTRPCVVVSPNELNLALRTIVVAPMTTVRRGYPWRAECRFRGVSGEVVVDQIRTVDRSRMLKRLGKLSPTAAKRTLGALQEMFA